MDPTAVSNTPQDMPVPPSDEGTFITADTPASPVGDAPSPNNSKPIKPSGPKPKIGPIIATVFGMLLVIGGLGVGLILVNNQQHTASQAGGISCSAGSCKDGFVYGADCNAPQTSCADRAADGCKLHGGPASGGGPAPACVQSTPLPAGTTPFCTGQSQCPAGYTWAAPGTQAAQACSASGLGRCCPPGDNSCNPPTPAPTGNTGGTSTSGGCGSGFGYCAKGPYGAGCYQINNCTCTDWATSTNPAINATNSQGNLCNGTFATPIPGQTGGAPINGGGNSSGTATGGTIGQSCQPYKIYCGKDNPSVASACSGFTVSPSVGMQCAPNGTFSGKCDYFDVCAPATQSGGTCNGKVQVSEGTDAGVTGGFVGCSGALDCYCGSGGTTTGHVFGPNDGNVNCVTDTGTVSCGGGGTPAPAIVTTPTQPNNPPAITASCSAVQAYDSNWNLLTQAQMSALTAGSKIYFTVVGTTSSSTFDKARFTINGTLQPDSTLTKPGASQEFYYQYTIPAGTTSFTVTAQLHHVTLDQWF